MSFISINSSVKSVSESAASIPDSSGTHSPPSTPPRIRKMSVKVLEFFSKAYPNTYTTSTTLSPLSIPANTTADTLPITPTNPRLQPPALHLHAPTPPPDKSLPALPLLPNTNATMTESLPPLEPPQPGMDLLAVVDKVQRNIRIHCANGNITMETQEEWSRKITNVVIAGIRESEGFRISARDTAWRVRGLAEGWGVWEAEEKEMGVGKEVGKEVMENKEGLEIVRKEV